MEREEEVEERRRLRSERDVVRGKEVGRERFSLPGGQAGLTAQQQRCLVPPGFLLKTRPPSPPTHHPLLSISLLCPLFLLRHHFSHHFPLSSFCTFSPSPSSCSCSVSFSSSISLTSLVSLPRPPPTPLHVWAITDTQQWAEEGWGWLWRLDGEIEGGTKGLRCSGPTRVAGFEKKPGGFLMQRVDGQTRADRQSGLSPLFSSFSRCLFSAKKAHHLPCALPSAPDVLSNTLR